MLAIARALAARINAEPGMQAVLTRDGDYFISCATASTARASRKADLFVSIHADSIANPQRLGFLGVRAVRCAALPARRRAGWPSARTRPT